MKNILVILLFISFPFGAKTFGQKGEVETLNYIIHRANELNNQKNHTEALRILIKGKFLYEKNPQIFYHIGLCHYYRKDYVQAISSFTYSIALKPNFTKAYLQRARAKKKNGSFWGYLKDMNKAQSINPSMTYQFVAMNLF